MSTRCRRAGPSWTVRRAAIRFVLPLAVAGLLAAPAAPASRIASSPSLELRMVPLWSVALDTLPQVVGAIGDAVVDEHDRVYLLDWQLRTVHVLDGQGRYLRALGREGDGPGELRAPAALLLLPDDALGVVSGLLARITVLDRDTGDPRPTLRLTGWASDLVQLVRARAVALPDGTPALVGVVGESLGRRWHLRYELVVHRLDGDHGGPIPPWRTIATVGLLQGRDVEQEEYYQLWRPWDVTADGRVAYAPDWDHCQVVLADPAGAHRPVTVDIPYRHRERTPRERRRLLASLWGGTSPEPFGIALETSDHEPAIREITARPDGTLWIRTGRSGDGAERSDLVRRYVVLGPDGRPRPDVVLRGDVPCRDATDRFLFLRDGDVVVIRGADIPPHDPDAVPPAVTRYRLVPVRAVTAVDAAGTVP